MDKSKLPTQEEINTNGVRELREDVEKLRRGIARLNGRLDILEPLLPRVPKALRFRLDDPAKEELSFSVPYICTHGVQYVITSYSREYLSFEYFDTSCDCSALWLQAESKKVYEGGVL